ncbi:hypothetical protein ACPXB1_25105 [Micromonospora sp. DT68]|uniref:hypothetical protein n=1 Tax=Micromonospora sp. DT68 TaxID=3416522 RepID=UPI003CEFA654
MNTDVTRADIANTSPATRRGRTLIAFIAIAAFGPYLAPGIRTEQTAVYLAALLLLAAGSWVGIRLTGAGLVAVALHGGIVAVALLGVVLPPPNLTLHKPADLSAGLDNLLLPLAVVSVVAMLAGLGADRAVMLRTVCRVTVWAMVINVGMAVASMGDAGTPRFLLIWRLGGDGESVADRAEQLGRYSGMFNQPAEAGLLYSVALIAAVYLYRSQPVRLAVVSLILAIGGALCVSKVALLVGLPVAVWQVMRPVDGVVAPHHHIGCRRGGIDGRGGHGHVAALGRHGLPPPAHPRQRHRSGLGGFVHGRQGRGLVQPVRDHRRGGIDRPVDGCRRGRAAPAIRQRMG